MTLLSAFEIKQAGPFAATPREIPQTVRNGVARFAGFVRLVKWDAKRPQILIPESVLSICDQRHSLGERQMQTLRCRRKNVDSGEIINTLGDIPHSRPDRLLVLSATY
jgi:hypothetical protein